MVSESVDTGCDEVSENIWFVWCRTSYSGKMVRSGEFLVDLVGLCGSVWVMGEWSADQWIAGVLCFQKMYGLYGLKHHVVEMSPMRDNQTMNERMEEQSKIELLTKWMLDG